MSAVACCCILSSELETDDLDKLYTEDMVQFK